MENDALAHAENQKNRKSHKSEYQKFKLSPALRFSRVDNKLQIRLCCFLFELRSDYVFYSNYAPPAIVVSCESANVKIAREFSPFTADRFSWPAIYNFEPLSSASGKPHRSRAQLKLNWALQAEKTLRTLRKRSSAFGLAFVSVSPSRAEPKAKQRSSRGLGPRFWGLALCCDFLAIRGLFWCCCTNASCLLKFWTNCYAYSDSLKTKY